MNIVIKQSFWLNRADLNLYKEEFKIIGDYEEDSTWILSRFLTSHVEGAGIAVPHYDGDGDQSRSRKIDFVFAHESSLVDYDLNLSPFQGTNIANVVEKNLGLKVIRSAEIKAVNDMSALDRGKLLKAYIIQNIIDEGSVWFRFSSDENYAPDVTEMTSLAMWMDDEEGERLNSHIRVVTIGEIYLQTSNSQSKIEVPVKAMTYRVRNNTLKPPACPHPRNGVTLETQEKLTTPPNENEQNDSTSIVINFADGLVYSVTSITKAVPLSAHSPGTDHFLTELDLRSRARGYLGYLRDDCTSLSAYWRLRAGVNIVDTSTMTISMIRVASLNCHYRDFEANYHTQYPGAEIFLPCAALIPLPVMIPFRSRVDYDTTIPLFATSLKKCCAAAFHDVTPAPASLHGSSFATHRGSTPPGPVFLSAYRLASSSTKRRREVVSKTSYAHTKAKASVEVQKSVREMSDYCSSGDSLDSLDSI